MKARHPDADGNYIASGTQTFNVRCEGGIMFNRVTLRNLRELRLDIIERCWSVQSRRYLTKEEIAKLCSGKLPAASLE
ncbi:MAG TPA: hypothetical protein VGI45_32085 [Terracidiphilus sp.]|jgi:hypothetical protein